MSNDTAFDILNVDLSDLTVGEMEEIEELTDQPFDALAKAGGKKAKLMRAIVYIVKRREDPDFTWEDAGNVRLRLTEEDPGPLDESA